MMGRHTARTVLALLLLAGQAGDGGCEPATGDGAPRSRVCEVDTTGIQVTEDGRRVTDQIRAYCTVPPRVHVFEAWLEFKTGAWGEWTVPRFPARSSIIPDREGVSLRVSLPCKEGYYRAAWRTTGRGPAVPGHPDGISFDLPDGDFGSTRVDSSECAGVN